MFINPYLLQQETQEHVERYRFEAKQVQLIYTLLRRKAARAAALFGFLKNGCDLGPPLNLSQTTLFPERRSN